MTIVRCGKCKSILNEPSDITPEKRAPCPSCGSTSRAFDVEITSGLKLHGSLGMKAKHPGPQKPFIEQFSGVELWRKFKKLVKKERIIDRDNNLYVERVEDIETGEIIHYCKEPLSKHFGHGSAKHKK